MIPFCLIVDDGAILLMKAYFPPNECIQVLPSQHPLLSKLTNPLAETDEIRRRVVDIIQSKPVQSETRQGAKTLETFYTGQLMKELRGKVNVDLARKIIVEEIDKHFEITTPVKKGGYYIVKKRQL